MPRTPQFAAFAVLAALATLAAPAAAQTAGQLKLIIPYAAGGGGDLIGRTLAAKMSEQLGRQMIPENRPGAGGQLGTGIAAKSAPDGLTWVIGGSGAISIGPHLQKLDYDPQKDLTPVAMIGVSYYCIAVNASVPANTLAELVALAKKDPKGISYSTTGIGSQNHLAGELLKNLSGANLVPIAYKGAGPASLAVISGEVPMAVSDLGVLLPQAQAGKVRILALINSSRSPNAPQIPTVAEAGYPGYGADVWSGIFGPAGLPAELLARYAGEFAKAINAPDVKATLKKADIEVKAMPLEEFRRFVQEDIRRWEGVVKAANIKL